MQALLGLMLMSPMAVNAATDDDASVDMLVLTMADQSTKEFKLDDKPEISFADGKFLVTASQVTTDYDQSEVTEFHFKKSDGTSTGINTGNEAQFSFVFNDNTNVRISGTKAKRASLYTIGGQFVKSQKVNGGSVNVSLADCGSGVYILNLENDHTFKLIKK